MKVIKNKYSFKNIVFSSKTIIIGAAVIFLLTIGLLASELNVLAKPQEAATVDVCTGFKLFQPNFFPLNETSASAIKTFDVNNDGVKDLITNLPNAGKIGVQFGDGEGGVLPVVKFDAGTNPVDLDLGDFNRDGEVDVITANSRGNKFSILLGDGAGNFSVFADYPSQTLPKLIKVGYFDSDNYLDVAVANYNSLKIFKGSRDLTFTLMSDIPTPAAPIKMVSTDFNKDGKTDLAISFDSGGSEVRVYLGQGSENFVLAQTFSGIQAYALSAADIDGNGKLDLIANDYQSNRFLAYKGNGDGSFQEPVISTVGAAFGSEVTDFNNDGKPDLISGSGSIYYGDGAGSFSLPLTSGVPSSESGIGIADFNSDDLPDIAVIASNNVAKGISIINNKGNGEIDSRPLFFHFNPYEIDSADFNGDGKYDFVTVNGYRNQAFVYLQNEQGAFLPTPFEGLTVGVGNNSGPYSITTADFNNDNKPDFAVPDAYSGKVAVFTGNGDGTFVKNTFNLLAYNVRPYFIRTADFNNDGYIDIVVTTRTNQHYSILLNNGADGFTLLPGGSVNVNLRDTILAVGDLTGDGIADLIYGDSQFASLTLAGGNGDGTFTYLGNIPSASYLNSVNLADLNNDGYLDIITAGSSNIMVRIQVPNSGFPISDLYPVPEMAHDTEIADFDLDGIKDMIAGVSTDSKLEFFKGTGNGTFSTPGVIMDFVTKPTSLVSKDFNNDGKPDLAFSSNSGGTVGVIYNDTNILPCLSVNDAPQVNEGNSGTVNVSFDVILSETASQAVTVDYKTVNRTAVSGDDFAQTGGTLTFQPGDRIQTVTIPVTSDTLDEEDETFTLTLNNPVNASISNKVGVAQIIDDDLPPSLSIGDASVLEGNDGETMISVPISLSGASGRRVKSKVSTRDLTARANEDYLPISENIFLDPGEVSKNIQISVIPDYRVEPDETFTVNLQDPEKVTHAKSQASATILNDDVGGVVQFSASDYTVSENAGTAQITITRANGNASNVIVYYTITNGTAVFGKDYTAGSGNITFGANETSKTFAVPIINDTLNEDPVETVNLTITGAGGGGALGTPVNTVLNIEDDDPLPKVRISSTSVTEGNQGQTAALLTVSLSEASGRNVGVNFSTHDGTAHSPGDYSGVNGVLSFAPGETAKTILVSVIGDRDIEPDENFQVALSDPSNAVIENNLGTVTVTNDDYQKNALFDFDGDGKADISVYRPENGTWYLNQSAAGFTGAQFGISTDKFVPADYDGDDKTDLAVFRDGTWYLQQSSAGFTGIQFGLPDDVPVPADYDKDGRADIAVFRPSNGTWYLLQSTAEFASTQFGQMGDKPVAGDYDGDGKADIAVVRQANGVSNWYIFASTKGFSGMQFGTDTDKLVPADYDADGKTDVAVFRPSNGTWYLLQSTAGFTGRQFGISTDMPTPADYDGDGKADIAVFRNGTWYLLQSTNGFTGFQFGAPTDKPVPNAFIP